jgi:hypothetical protein
MKLNRIVKASSLKAAITLAPILALALATLLLAACGSGSAESSNSAEQATAAKATPFNGTVHGGQSPVSGSTVTLYAAGSGISGSSVLASTTTDANGNFVLSSFSCPSTTTPTYLISAGGNPGLAAGTNNSALQLMAALGPCGSIPASVDIDEVTTVAAAYALNGFIGGSGCVDCSGGVPANVSNVHGKNPGLANAMGNAARLASVASGSASPPLPTASACAASSPPVNCGVEARLDSLANSLAACVNSTGPTSAQCVELFDCATPGATYSGGACTVPGGSNQAADTLTAVLEIARNPAQVSVAGIYNVATPNTVFSPTLSGAPSDWTLALNITGGGLGLDDSPQTLAIDAAGNVWVANSSYHSLVEFSPAGAPLSGSSGYTGGGLSDPFSLAIDALGNVWLTNLNNGLSKFSSSGTAISGSSTYTGGGLTASTGSVYLAIDPSGNVWEVSNSVLAEFNSSGTALSPTSGYTGSGLYYPEDLAIDASGNIWIPNQTSSSTATYNLVKFSNSGSLLSGSSGYTGGGLDYPQDLAIDASGNIWVGNNYGAVLSEFSNNGTPLSGSGYTGGGVGNDYGVAIDGGGNVWLADINSSQLSEFNSAGAPLSGSSGYRGGGLDGPISIAIDPSGDVWTSNFYNDSLTEIIGAAVPTRTPLVSAMTNGFTP